MIKVKITRPNGDMIWEAQFPANFNLTLAADKEGRLYIADIREWDFIYPSWKIKITNE